MQTSKMYYIKDPNGHIYEIPEENLDAALDSDKRNEHLRDYQPPVVSNQRINDAAGYLETSPHIQSSESPPHGSVLMKDKDGAIFEIPPENINAAQKAGGIIVDKNGNEPSSSQSDNNTLGKTIARSAKTIASEIVGSVPDAITSIYNIPAAIQNASNEATKNDNFEIDPISGMPVPRVQGERADLPLIPSVASKIDSSIDSATGGYTNTSQGDSLQSGLRLGTAIATPGGLSKVASKYGKEVASKALGALGTTKISGIASAAITGGVSEEAEKAGYGKAASLALGLGAGGVSGSVAGLTKSAVNSLDTKLALAKLTGNSPKNIDLEAVNAARSLNLSIPNTIANESKGLALAEQIISKTPYFGTKYAKRLKKFESDYINKVQESIEKIGEKIVESEHALDTGNMLKETMMALENNVKNESESLYKHSEMMLPKNAAVIPHNVVITLKKIKNKLSSSLRPSETQKYVLDFIRDTEGKLFKQEVIPTSKLTISPDLTFKFDTNNKIHKSTLSSVPVSRLVDSKVSLNELIDWDIATPPGAKGYLKLIQNAYLQDISSYGKTNHKWYQAFNDADRFYGNYLGDEALGSSVLRKKIFAQEDPYKIIGSLNKISDFKKIEKSLAAEIANSPGNGFFNSIKREKLAELILGETINKNNGNISYVGFTKSLQNKQNRELIRYLAGDNYKDLLHLNSSAKAANRHKLRNPNPSGTAPTKLIYSLFAGGLGGSLKAGVAGAVAGAATPLAVAGLAGTGLSWIVNNKRAINWGIEAAEKYAKGDFKSAEIINKRILRLMSNDLGEDVAKQFAALSRESLNDSEE